ncbi:MAG: GNAT family N-acetyltransferase [Eubacteriales bacterium]|nr:GNAT family N-acetyltransferase [Eubacteriales bacterium]
MELIIKKLSPELLDDFLKFFDETAHNTQKVEDRCYCVGWGSARYDGQDFSTAQKRRDAAIAYVRGNDLQGYLAYCGEKVVGWCNANTKALCRECQYGKMYLGCADRPEASPDIRVKSVFCFVVAPEMRRQGVAERLLRSVCEDARQEGFDYVEAYPNKSFVDTLFDCMGPRKLYEKEGFAPAYEIEPKVVMRKELK